MNLKIYENTLKLKYRRRPLNLLEIHSQSSTENIRRWMRAHFPNATHDDHIKLRDEAIERLHQLEEMWAAMRDKEFERVFGRKMELRDYKVSAVVRNEFSQEVKTEMRSLTNQSTIYDDIADAHNLMLPKSKRL